MVEKKVPPSNDRVSVARKLEALLNRRFEKVKDVPEREIDAVVDEAVDHVRHSRA
jgi:hypothetical protein